MKQYFKITHERTKKIKAKDVKVALANFIASLDKCEVREFKQHPHSIFSFGRFGK